MWVHIGVVDVILGLDTQVYVNSLLFFAFSKKFLQIAKENGVLGLF